ncbi:MAG: hypothetical protein ACI86H_000532 [bacterium]|jgi:uncharacterized protein YxeA
MKKLVFLIITIVTTILAVKYFLGRHQDQDVFTSYEGAILSAEEKESKEEEEGKDQKAS